jgi:hypothetical protein
MHAYSIPPFDKTEKQNNKIGTFHSNTKLFGKRRPSPCMHPKSIIPYMQPMFHQKKIAAIVPLDLGWSSALSHGKSPRELLGPAETGHLPGSCQACLKGMVQ